MLLSPSLGATISALRFATRARNSPTNQVRSTASVLAGSPPRRMLSAEKVTDRLANDLSAEERKHSREDDGIMCNEVLFGLF